MGIPEYCRKNSQRLKFTGFAWHTETGTYVSINGNNWTLSENGFHREEDPKGNTVIYEAPATTGENGKTAKKIEGSVEIAASTS